jgi:hypothetical protein
MENEIIEKDERISDDSNNSVPAIFYKREMLREKYSLQENNEYMNDQDIALAGEKSCEQRQFI